MIFELVGSRVLAPYIGTSTIVWTSLIGMVLLSLSLGYYIGGKVADRNPRRIILSIILFLSAVSIAYTGLVKESILALLIVLINNVYVSSVVAAFLLFSPASIFLGMISPYAIRLSLKDIKHSGQTVGGLFAIGTIGSIVGTFFAGFFLIPFLGTNRILFFLALLMLGVSFLVLPKKVRKIEIFLVFIMIGAIFSFKLVQAQTGPGIILDVDSRYNRIWLSERFDSKYKLPIRVLQTDPRGFQGAVYLDNDRLVFDYLKFFSLAEHFNPNINEALLIGGGIYSFAENLSTRLSSVKLDVVEIDPKLFELAEKYFRFTPNNRIKVINEDGRVYINRSKKKYDSIYMDAFGSHFSIPFQLTTIETVERLYDMLNNNGVVAINLISAIDNKAGRFLQAEYKTYKAVFPFVYVFPLNSPDNGDVTQNIVMMAIKADSEPKMESDNKVFKSYLRKQWRKEIESEVAVLSDDHAPVDYYILK